MEHVNNNNGHAILSPSGASRWLACTKSALLEQQFEDRAGEAAQEGTLAHKIGEILIKRDTLTNYQYALDITPCLNDPLYKPEMMGYMEDFASFVIERFNAAKAITPDAILEQEVKLPLEKFTGEKGAYGTGDNIIIADGTMEVIDLKYGKGVRVEAEENKQMILYALGALELYAEWYQIDRVKMTIYQPRIDNFSTWICTVGDLICWANYIIPVADMALHGKGDFVVGDHCQFCRAKPVCKKHADYQMEIAKHDFLDPALLNDTEVVDILKRKKAFTDWLKAIDEYALAEAVLKNKKWPEMKLVEGRSVRKYSDQEKVAAVLIEDGWTEEQIYKKELFGITAMTGVLTKKVFETLVGPFLVKPPGKPTLVAETDKRDEINSLDAAKSDFHLETETED
jgi:hypothetical protein